MKKQSTLKPKENDVEEITQGKYKNFKKTEINNQGFKKTCKQSCGPAQRKSFTISNAIQSTAKTIHEVKAPVFGPKNPISVKPPQKFESSCSLEESKNVLQNFPSSIETTDHKIPSGSSYKLPAEYSPPINNVNKAKVMAILEKCPARIKSTLAAVNKYLKSAIVGLNDEEKAWLIFRWISINIEYNFKGYTSGNYGDLSPEGVFKKGQGVCSGYSTLFNNMAKNIGLEAVSVEGYAKGYSYVSGMVFEKTNHDWNAVKINNVWYLIDSTWGAGHICNGKFNQHYTEYYFCPDPKNLIRSHCPLDSKWQLLNKPITKKEFEQLLGYDASFYEAGLVNANPDITLVASGCRAKYKITCKPESNSSLMANVFVSNGNAYREISGAHFIQRMGNEFIIDVAYPHKGKYSVELYASLPGKTYYDSIFKYEITCNEEPTEQIKFPITYRDFSNIVRYLHTPIHGPLSKASTVKFSMDAPNAAEISVVSGGAWTKLEKTGETFEGDVKITSGDLNVYYKNEGMSSFLALLTYDVIGQSPDLLSIDSAFYEAGLISATPEFAVITSSSKAKYKICAKPESTTSLMANVSIIEGSTYTKIPGLTFIQRIKNEFQIDVAYPKKGKYRVQFYATLPGKTIYDFIFEYTVICNENAVQKITFPQAYNGFSEIISLLRTPVSGPLKKGSSVFFSLDARYAEEIVAVSGSDWFHFKKIEDTFSSNVKITSNDLIIYYKNTGMPSYSALISYDVID